MKLDNKGFTLIEALFSFFIYINIIVMFISLVYCIQKSLTRLDNEIMNLNVKEEIELEIDGFEDLIKKVLH